jgi:16S rRNA processing protein RimM
VDDRLILMGVIGKAHGVRGLLRVNCFTEDPDSLEQYTLTTRAGRGFMLEWQHENVARLSEITPQGPRPINDRNEAETLTNTELFAPRTALPEPEEDEFYLADLIGLAAQDQAGEPLGTIAAVHDFGAGASLELSPGERLIPFTRAAVPIVNIQAGHVVIIPPTEIAGGAEQ